ncbi:uncharacterized protein VICG_01113 [Vittaforma corneae ATCC 50505]|uniref:FAD/NAD(P)-binding domain-containing protein n=1 Tax=Vittaforma corneae (strain ATCC 50505) TaxID=993615 RepID=L2GMR2_VITCO|nr:uncharacterized protein VICG_01113 [Vittaforma corneae ATCC 50505]ELA41929.1 hypothetical protein VICG_01113 [Vittaforma corneae ATCC 50505]
MRACVLGGGPSGIFVSEYLNNRGIAVELFEKSNTLLGNYKYARNKIDLLKNLNATVHLNSDENAIDDSKCDIYVIATGGKQKELDIEGSKYTLKAMDVIKNYYNDDAINDKRIKSLLNNNDSNVCIIGMGNVALDLAYYLKDKVSSITILSRGDLSKATFDNHVMREIINSNIFEINIIGNFEKAGDRKTQKRCEMLRNTDSKIRKLVAFLQRMFFGVSNPQLNLIFNTYPQSIKKNGDQVEVCYSVNNELKKSVFDAAISSIGFIPNLPIIKTAKPMYYTGWCVNSKGNIGDAMVNARTTVDNIIKANSVIV